MIQNLYMRAIILGSAPHLEPWSISQDPPYTLRSWQDQAFASAGISDIAVIPSSLGKNRLGMLLHASPFLEKESCLIVYGDLAIDSTLLRAMSSGIESIEILCEPRSAPSRSNGSDVVRVTYDSNQRLTGVLTTPREARRSSTAGSGRLVGLWRISPEGWARIRRVVDGVSSAERHRMDIQGMLSRLIRSQARVQMIPATQGWREVVAPESVQLGEHSLTQPRSRKLPALLRQAA